MECFNNRFNAMWPVAHKCLIKTTNSNYWQKPFQHKSMRDNEHNMYQVSFNIETCLYHPAVNKNSQKLQMKGSNVTHTYFIKCNKKIVQTDITIVFYTNKKSLVSLIWCDHCINNCITNKTTVFSINLQTANSRCIVTIHPCMQFEQTMLKLCINQQ